MISWSVDIFTINHLVLKMSKYWEKCSTQYHNSAFQGDELFNY